MNNRDDKKGVLELANFAGQGIVSNIIAFILHHYTDSDMVQLDNVGSGTILTLKNAQNPVRRSDKDSDYVGTGNFIELYEHNNSAGYAEKILMVTKDGEFFFTGVKGSAVFSSNKNDNNLYSFELKNYKTCEYILRIVNGDKGQIFNINNDSTNTRVKIETSSTQTNGMLLKTNVGELRLTSGSTGNEDLLLEGRRIRVSFDNGTNYYGLQTTQYGTTADRPTFCVPGQMYFDTDLNKPIWRNGDNNGWVDATGASV